MRNRKKLKAEAEDLNLAPIMNLMVTLIPMLLLSISFVKLAVLNTNLPVYSNASTNELSNVNNKKLNLTVAITEEGLTVGGSGGIIGDGNSSIPKLEDGTYDIHALSDILQKIKENYPSEYSITVVPEITTKYATIVEVMDTVREYRIVSTEGKMQTHLLFPNIAIGGGIIWNLNHAVD